MLLYLIIPIAGALAFPLPARLLQRAMERAREPWGVLMISNVVTALVFVPPFMLQAGGVFSPKGSPFYQPLLCGLLFFIGQIAGYKSFAIGDLSLAVPLQGTKVLMVALLALFFLGRPVGWNIWMAGALIPVSIYFLQKHPPGKREQRKYWGTFFLATVGALTFAGLDLGIQVWSRGWGIWRFGFWTFLSQAILSLGLYFLPGRAARFRRPPEAWGLAFAGSLGMAFVSLGLAWVISRSGRAAWVNILFNSRVLWSVLFVWLAGNWMGGRETRQPGARGILTHRLIGAALMVASVVLAVAL